MSILLTESPFDGFYFRCFSMPTAQLKTRLVVVPSATLLICSVNQTLYPTLFPPLAPLCQQPSMLACSSEGLRLKWQRLQVAASHSHRWQAELFEGEGDLSLLADAICAPHVDIDRLTYLCGEGRQEGCSLGEVGGGAWECLCIVAICALHILVW